jgi:2-phosphosulfolactate phosphatase
MEIRVVDFVAGARAAEGVVIVIDVFRAFSVACYAFSRGAKQVIPVGDVEEAFELRKRYTDALLVGERGGKMLRGFDHGNSPTEILELDLSGRTLIHTTHAGTQGLVNATKADVVFTGALVNAKATAQCVRSFSPNVVTLVRMGLEAEVNSDEDDLCAIYLESLLLDHSFDTACIESQLRSSPFSQRFFDESMPWSPASDFELCVDVDRFNFAVQAEQIEAGQLSLRSIFP